MSMYGKYPGFPKPVVDCSKDVRLTVQADAAEADINKIIARIDKGGMLTRINRSEPFYGDISEFGGLQESIIKVQKANELFMDMSAAVRERFDNDPVKMIDFLGDDDNLDEAIALGMVLPKVVPPKDPIPPTPVPEPE